MPTPSRIARHLTTLKVALIAFAFLLVTKWPVLDQPPVWDAAMSVFPAAITLAHNGFDLAELLHEPGYVDGGPNVHSLSLVTWITALVYGALGDRPDIVLPVLHLLHFALAAWALTSLWRLGVHWMPAGMALPRRRLWALAATVAFGVCPLFFVQAGFLYLELPILAFTLAAVLAWVEGRRPNAAAFATGSAMVKPSGLIVAGSLALATLLSAGTLRERLMRVAGLLAGPLAIAAGHFWLRPATTQNLASIRATVASILAIPDVALILLCFLVVLVVIRPWSAAVSVPGFGRESLSRREPEAESEPESEPDLAARAALVGASFFVTFFSFYALLIPLQSSVPILPRYYLQLLPFAVLGSLACFVGRRPRGVATVLLALAIVFLANRRGHFYPDSATPNFAFTERSMAYAELLDLQNGALRTLIETAEGAPVFYGLNDHYKLAYPAMGYGIEPPARGQCIYFEPPYFLGHLRSFPPEFYMLVDYPWLGGEVVLGVAAQAREDPRTEVLSRPVEVGRFQSQLIHVRPSGAGGSAEPGETAEERESEPWPDES